MNTFCSECGFNVRIDEDGLCVHCGATAVGLAVDEMFEVLQQLADDKGSAYWTSEEVRKIAGDLLKAHTE